MNNTAFTFATIAEAVLVVTGILGLIFVAATVLNEIDGKVRLRNNFAVAALTVFFVGTLITFILLTAAVNL